MSITKKDISLIIQGPLDDTTISSLDTYKEFGEIIISSWVDSDFSKLKNLKKNAVKILISEYPESTKTAYNDCNFYFQLSSTFYGVSESSKPYCLVVRSDELYPNTDSLIQKLNEHPEKHITSNIFFLKDSKMHFHCCSHLALGRTEDFILVYGACKDLCERPNYFGFEVVGKNLVKGDIEIHGERVLGYMRCYLKGSTTPTIQNAKLLMQENFEVVPLSNLNGFMFSCNSSGSNPSAPYFKCVKSDWFTGRPDICSDIKEL